MLQENITRRLEETITFFVKNGHNVFMTGGALGFDTLAAEAVLRIRERCPFVKLILALPCRTQTHNWGKENVARYEKIRNEADKVIFVSEEYTKGCMFKRNRYLVDHSSLCICYLIENKGGTFYTVNYAKQQGKSIIHLEEKQ